MQERYSAHRERLDDPPAATEVTERAKLDHAR
jgi:hypothetical protein